MRAPAPRKLIEVALPLEAIDVACQADKDRKTGSIRNLHKWFAPMPVPAWRALLFAALVDDPGNPAERRRLWALIEALVASGPDAPPATVVSQALTEIRRSNPQGVPTVVDPFCGGGSTLVEAQRLGLLSQGSDLNPVPALITRTLCDLVPRALLEARANNWSSGGLGPPSMRDFQDDVLRWAGTVGARVRNRIAHLYPDLPGGEVPYAWLWTWNAPCPNPACRLRTPLVSSWRLSSKKGAYVFAAPIIAGDHVRFTVSTGVPTGPPEVKTGRAEFKCVRCSETLTASYLRQASRSGHLACQLLAIAAIRGTERIYLAPTPEQEAVLQFSVEDDSFLRIPIAEGGLGIRVPLWGLMEQRDLYTARQANALIAFADEVSRISEELSAQGAPPTYAKSVASVLGLAVSRLAMHNSKQVKWFTRDGPSKADPALREPNLPFVSTFAETNPFGGSVGDWIQVVQTSVRAFDYIPTEAPPAKVLALDARKAAEAVPAGGRSLIATDPPYFGHIGYADLSDYFYVWLRRSLANDHPDLFATLAAPRAGELVANAGRHSGNEDAARDDFVEGFTEIFQSLGHADGPDLPMLIVYAHREFEGAHGWEAMLTAVFNGGLRLVGTWPIEASRANRLRNVRSNALASYVVLVCRSRPADAERVSLRAFDGELRERLRGAVRELQDAATAPVDLAQAVIGRGMAVFTQYREIVAADGSALTVAMGLQHINRVLAEVLGDQELDFDAPTRFALTWFEQRGTETGSFGEADALARAKNVAVNGLTETGIVDSRAGKVRLMRREELRDDWNPTADGKATAWASVQHMVSCLERDGEIAASDLLARLGENGAVVRDLAYRIFNICEKKGWTDEARAVNALVVAWPELERHGARVTTVQGSFEV